MLFVDGFSFPTTKKNGISLSPQKKKKKKKKKTKKKIINTLENPCQRG